MFPGLQPPKAAVPAGWRLLQDPDRPDTVVVNGLLQACGQPDRSLARLGQALQRSDLLLSLWRPCKVRQTHEHELVGLVRATSDQSLNVNLWDLCVLPELEPRGEYVRMLIAAMLVRLRLDLPGCSISLVAGSDDIAVLEQLGFHESPKGIRVMELSLQP